MDVFNSITFITDLHESDPQISETPARLKLRTKTLSGIKSNMNRIDAADSIFSIPTAFLAKKKKKVSEKKEDKEPVVSLEEVKEEEPVLELVEPVSEKVVPVVEEKNTEEGNEMINATVVPDMVNGDRNYRQLKASLEKKEAMEQAGIKMMGATPQVEQPVYQMPTVEVPSFNIETGISGEVSNVEPIQEEVKPIIDEKPAPSLDEVREKILGPVETKTNVEESAMDEASAEEIFAETAKLKDEVQQLQAKDKELSNNLSDAKATYDSVVNASTELEKTLASRREEKQSKKKMFYQVASKQKQMMSDYKENLLSRQEQYRRELEEINSKTASLRESNSVNEEAIQKENDEITKFDNLINAVSSFELPEMENDYQKRLVA